MERFIRWKCVNFVRMKTIIRVLIVALLTLVTLGNPLKAQYKVATGIAVIEQGSTLKNPWVGGFNAPIFSVIDLNGDGVKDLFVFDREGNRISTYINNGTSGQVDYVFAPEFEKAFPEGMSDFAMLVDYDNDGKEDIFTYSVMVGGMKVYRNDYTPGNGLSFTETYPIVNSKYGSFIANLYVARVNLPGIIDVDGDCDLDVLTFPVLGNYVEYHRNRAWDLYGRCDTLVFEVEQNCWGNFGLSGFSNTAVLNAGCRLANPAPPVPVDPSTIDDAAHGLHSGSCMLITDIDGDGDKDFFNGDMLGTNILEVINGGNATQANMVSQDSLFPVYDTPVNLFIFPGPYYFDVNNDGNKDFVVAPCISGPAENFDNVWYYRNTTNNLSNVFQFQFDRLFVDEMIEVGAGAMPQFVDVDTDGLTDMLIGNYGYYSAVLPFKSGLAWYRNTGTLSNPQFTLQTRDLGGFQSLGLLSLAPTIGDLDNDGDNDLIMGNADGYLIYYRNMAGAGNPPVYSLFQPSMTDNNGNVIDVGQNSTPQMIDVNRDGRIDLLIGERNGNLNYYQNIGSATAHSLISVNSGFGGINVTNYMNLYGYSYPHLYDSAGIYRMLVGSTHGYLYQFDNIDNNLTGTFTLTDSIAYGIIESANAAASVADINGNGYFEVLIGNNAGGVTLYVHDSTTALPEIKQTLNVTLYPNPATDYVVVGFGTSPPVARIISLSDVTGRRIEEKNLLAGSAYFDVSTLPSGVYLIRVIEGDQVLTRKLVLK